MIFKRILTLFLCLGLLTNAYSQENCKTFYVKEFSNSNLEVFDWGGNGKPIFFLHLTSFI